MKSAALRGIDATLRLLNLTSQAAKRVCKMTVEWFANTLTILTKFIAKPFVNPENNKVSEWFITAKTDVFAFFGAAARDLKDVYRWSRNGIARELRPVEHTNKMPAHKTSSSARSIAGLGINRENMKDGLLAGQTLSDKHHLDSSPANASVVIVAASDVPCTAPIMQQASRTNP